MKNTMRWKVIVGLCLEFGLLNSISAAAATARQGERHFYLGPAVSRLSVGGDFDGESVFTNDDRTHYDLVPKFDSALGFGGLVGLRGTLTHVPIDLAVELMYQQGSMSNTFDGIANTDKATLHEVGWTMKGYFRADHSLQPFLAAGFDINWLTVPGGEISPFVSHVGDETFHGIGGHTGAGLCYFIASDFSVEGSVLYHYREFTTINDGRLHDSLNSGSIEPTLAIHYHFKAFGAATTASTSAANAPASSPSPAPSSDSLGKDPNIL